MKTMDRKEFLSLVGTSVGAIILQSCISGCSKNEPITPAPSPGTGGTGGTGGGGTTTVDLTLILTEAANSALQNNGGFIFRSGIIIARTNAGNFVAVSQACTHAGTTVEFQPNNDQFFCNNHGSRFGLNGAVANGPAMQPLKAYQTTFNAAQNTLRVFE